MEQTSKVRSVCPYCGVGCGMVMEVSGQRVIKLSGDKEHPSNFGRLCTKGSTAAQAITAPGRMEYAYYRTHRTGDPSRIKMENAIKETAERMRNLLEKYGPESLSFYVSGQMSLEAQYLINKLAKGFIRTNQIESNSRLCMASAGSGYKLSLGADGPPGSYQDFDKADLFFVIGSNMADCHPILFLRLMDRVKAGAKLIVVDPRRTATAKKAHLYMQIRPGTDLALLNGLLHLLVKNGQTDAEFIANHTAGFEEMPEFLEDYPPDRVSEITGIPEADIVKAADWIGSTPRFMSCWTMGLNQSTQGTWDTNAISNLHLATGAICRPGSGPFSLTGQPNAMGGREMGYMGPGLPGQRSALVEADRKFIEKLWGVPPGTIPDDAGAGGTVAMFEDMAAGKIKACWIICTNPVATVPNRSKVIRGLEAAELVITQDAFLDTETNRYADIMLPGALWAEGDGVMVNSERNLTLMSKAVNPPGEAMPDWEIIARVACEMGYGDAFAFTSAEEVYAELQQAWNPLTGYDLRGATYERLRKTPVQWPSAPDSDNDRNPIRYMNSPYSSPSLSMEGSAPTGPVFPTSHGKAIFWPRPYMPPAEMPDNDYPFVLNTGRLPHQWHTLTKTGKIEKLGKLNPGPFLEIHPGDAASLGITEGDSVEVNSKRGVAVLPAVVTDRVPLGSCFAPFHWNDCYGEQLAINGVTSDFVDPLSLQPIIKYCAVSLAKVNAVPEQFPDIPVKEAVPLAQLDTLTSLLGLNSSQRISLEQHEQAYLLGFITSLRSGDYQPTHSIPVLPPAAPLAPNKRYWIDGLLAGMFSRSPMAGEHGPIAVLDEHPPAVDEKTGLQMNIVWASQTGNAERAATVCADIFRSKGYTVHMIDMKDFAVQDLAGKQNCLFVVSTYGDGDPPDNGESFYQALLNEQSLDLSHTRYAVLALGDSSYESFCGFGRNLNTRLEQMGAVQILQIVCCDTGMGDMEHAMNTWAEQVVQTLKRGEDTTSVDETGTTGAAGMADMEDTADMKAQVNATDLGKQRGEAVLSGAMQAKTLVSTAVQSGGVRSRVLQSETEPLSSQVSVKELAPAKSDPGVSEQGTRQNPYYSRMLFNQQLNLHPSEKETRHYAFDLRSDGLTLSYEAGDAMGILPQNCSELVSELLTVTGLEGAIPVRVKGQTEMRLDDALKCHFNISRPSQQMLNFIAEHASTGDQSLAMLLGKLSKERGAMNDWLWGRQLVDILREYRISIHATELIEHLSPLQPRLYSIASSPKCYPEEVHILVNTVRYEYGGRMRKGVCSTYLADRVASGAEVPIYIQKNAHFRPPADPLTPMIMVGAGTGIAPFRGFLQDRQATGAKGNNWVFFGEQREKCDYYFKEELEQFRKDGYLHRLDTAFSRDQAEKVYVQHRMISQGEQVWAWLQDGAHFYVCGDASLMAKDVDSALHQIIRHHGGVSEEQAAEYVKDMKRTKRYVRDVY